MYPFSSLLFNLIICLFICLFVVCLKSSLGRGSIGSSYLLAVTTLLVPNAEQEIYLYLFILFNLPLFLFPF